MFIDNGVTWQNDHPGTGYQKRFNGIAFGNNIFVGVGVDNDGLHARWATSTDGVVWENEVLHDNMLQLFDVAFGNGTFIAVGYKMVMSSPDGINWSNHYQRDVEFRSATYSDDKFIIIGRSTQDKHTVMMISEDNGVNWEEGYR